MGRGSVCVCGGGGWMGRGGGGGQHGRGWERDERAGTGMGMGMSRSGQGWREESRNGGVDCGGNEVAGTWMGRGKGGQGHGWGEELWGVVARGKNREMNDGCCGSGNRRCFEEASLTCRWRRGGARKGGLCVWCGVIFGRKARKLAVGKGRNTFNAMGGGGFGVERVRTLRHLCMLQVGASVGAWRRVLQGASIG